MLNQAIFNKFYIFHYLSSKSIAIHFYCNISKHVSLGFPLILPFIFSKFSNYHKYQLPTFIFKQFSKILICNSLPTYKKYTILIKLFVLSSYNSADNIEHIDKSRTYKFYLIDSRSRPPKKMFSHINLNNFYFVCMIFKLSAVFCAQKHKTHTKKI